MTHKTIEQLADDFISENMFVIENANVDSE